MALNLFHRKAKQRQAMPPAAVSPEDKFRSPFTDQREDAPDNWARPAVQPNTAEVPPVTTGTMPVVNNWQTTGYHMEDTRADHTAPINDVNDPGYVTPDRPDWRDDPFGDGGAAPELEQQRSPELINRSSPFFEAVTPEGQAPTATAAQEPVPYHGQGRAGSRVWLWVSLIVVVLVIVGAGVYSNALRITEIEVEGNVNIAAEEIIRLSGIREGSNVLALDDDKIAAGIHTNSYLVYNGITRESLSHIVISVRERIPTAYINYCGIIYIIDNRGNLLAESDDTDHPPELMRLEGVEIRSAPMGEKLIPTSAEKLDLYVNIMLELKAMKAQDKVVELYVSDMDNLYLGTKEGYSVHLGGKQELHAKLRAMLLTVDELNARNAVGGTIDVSTPVSPNYIPENGATI